MQVWVWVKGLEDPADANAMYGRGVDVVVMVMVFVDVEEVVFVGYQGRGELLARYILLNRLCNGDSVMTCLIYLKHLLRIVLLQVMLSGIINQKIRPQIQMTIVSCRGPLNWPPLTMILIVVKYWSNWIILLYLWPRIMLTWRKRSRVLLLMPPTLHTTLE